MKVISEGPLRITKATIDAAWRRRQPDRRLVLRDMDCRGLALIVNATSMTWTYAYRPRGNDPLTGRRWPNKTMTLGNPATHSAEDARAEANRIKGQAAAGDDPAQAKRARAAEQQRKRATTLGRLLDDYKKALPRRRKMRGAGVPSPNYVAEELAQARMALADMKAEDTPARDLTAGTVLRLIDDAEGVTTARKRCAALSRFLDWCREAQHIETNPCTLIARERRPRAPQARSVYLEPPALARLWKSAGELHEPVWTDLIRFLIAVPCRRGEATGLDWSHLDLERAEWRQPERLTKNRDPHRLHLHPLAVEVLRSRWRARVEAEADGNPATLQRLMVKQPRSSLVFPAPRSGGEIDTFTKIKVALVDATAPEDADKVKDVLSTWTWHDFRRSFASALGEAGVAESVADAILNHRQSASRGGVLGVYQRSSRWPEQVAAMRRWGEVLSAEIAKSRDAMARVLT